MNEEEADFQLIEPDLNTETNVDEIVLDEKKIIKAKRIDHTNLVSVFEMLEAKEKDKK